VVLSEWTTGFSFLVRTKCQACCLTSSRGWPTRRCNARCAQGLCGRERLQETFGRLVRKKSGVAPAQSGVFFCVTFLILVLFISSFSRNLCASQAEEDGEDGAEVGNSYLLHLIHLHPSLVYSRIPPRTRANTGRNFYMGWSDPGITLATEPCAKVGSLQPNTVFCPRPNWAFCRAQALLLRTLA